MRYCLTCRAVGAGVTRCRYPGQCRIADRGWRATVPNDTIAPVDGAILEEEPTMNSGTPLPGDAGPPLRTPAGDVVDLAPKPEPLLNEAPPCAACGHKLTDVCARGLDAKACRDLRARVRTQELASMNLPSEPGRTFETASSAGNPTRERVAEKAHELMEAQGLPVVRSLLSKHGSPDGKLANLPPERYQAFLADVSLALVQGSEDDEGGELSALGDDDDDPAPMKRKGTPVEEPKTRAGEFLREAAKIVDGARNQTHGDKERSFEAIARLWTGYLQARKNYAGCVVRAKDVAAMMVLLKFARAEWGDFVPDHAVDAAGYSASFGELAEAEKRAEEGFDDF